MHDFYSDSDHYTWNRVFQDYDQKYLDNFYRFNDDRGRYRLVTLTGAGVRTGDSGKPWRGVDLLPTAMEVPEIEIDHLEFESDKLIGSRGVGEGGTILAPTAILNAIEDAIVAAGGAPVTESPVTPTRVLQLLGVIERDG